MTSNFLRGVSSAFNLFPSREPFQSLFKKYSSVSDADALRNDWISIGKDLNQCIQKTLKHDSKEHS